MVTILDLEQILQIRTEETAPVTAIDNPTETGESVEPTAIPIRKEESKQHIIVAEKDNELFGLLVDSATEVLSYSSEQLKQIPELLKHHPCADDVQGVLVLDVNLETEDDAEVKADIAAQARMIMVLDLQKILADITADDSAVTTGTL